MTGKNPKEACGVIKNPYSTISQAVMAEVGIAMLEGARKYGRHNYRTTNITASIYYDAVRRHIDAWWEGEDIDPDTGIHHVTKTIASLTVLRDSMIQNKIYDDRPPKTPPEHREYIKGLMAGVLERLPKSVEPFTERNKK